MSIYIRYIKTGFNYCRRYQNIDIAIHKIIHDPLKLMFLHLSMRIYNICFRDKPLHTCCHIRYPVYPVVHVIHLTFTCQFSDYGFAHKLISIFTYKCLYRLPLVRSFFENAHIPYPRKAHMKCTWDRCRRKRKDIDILFHFLDLLFMSHAEPLFLIDYEKSQILEYDIF